MKSTKTEYEVSCRVQTRTAGISEMQWLSYPKQLLLSIDSRSISIFQTSSLVFSLKSHRDTHVVLSKQENVVIMNIVSSSEIPSMLFPSCSEAVPILSIALRFLSPSFSSACFNQLQILFTRGLDWTQCATAHSQDSGFGLPEALQLLSDPSTPQLIRQAEFILDSNEVGNPPFLYSNEFTALHNSIRRYILQSRHLLSREL